MNKVLSRKCEAISERTGDYIHFTHLRCRYGRCGCPKPHDEVAAHCGRDPRGCQAVHRISARFAECEGRHRCPRKGLSADSPFYIYTSRHFDLLYFRLRGKEGDKLYPSLAEGSYLKLREVRLANVWVDASRTNV